MSVGYCYICISGVSECNTYFTGCMADIMVMDQGFGVLCCIAGSRPPLCKYILHAYSFYVACLRHYGVLMMVV